MSADFTPIARARALLGVRYEIEREVGHGASAHVYLAFDRERSERVAIKLLRPELARAISGARFIREMSIGKRLNHPNILAPLETGSIEERPYFTMPFVDGETLRERLARETRLSLAEALTVVRQIALALDYAHSQGVVHRDIKPANILLSGTQVLVADFGIARAITVTPGDELTASGFAVGTPEYMSPEQISAEPVLDGRTDVYALGCVFYEMLAGDAPFVGPTAQATMARHHMGIPPSMLAIHPRAPLPIEQAIVRALAKDPAQRFASAGEFVAALGA